MQAVVAICHFCENHGPRVVMTCQPLRDFDNYDANLFPSSSNSPSTSATIYDPTTSGLNTGTDSKRLPSSDPSTQIPFHFGKFTRTQQDPEDRCKACSSFGNGPCLLSNDIPNKTSYISSQIALHSRVYERVHNACVRSLSCEISTAPRKNTSMPPPSHVPNRPGTPGRKEEVKPRPTTAINIGVHSSVHVTSNPAILNEVLDAEMEAEEADGCVIFGDADNGFCFAYIFRLADAKARGFHRLFSLIVVSNDLTFLTGNFEYFKSALGVIKSNLQQLASTTYEKEMRAGEEVDDEVMRPEYASVVGRMPRWFRRKIAIDTDRNLETITDQEDIWTKLHRQMMWTLRSPALTCRDQVMEGKPTQDMMVLMELDESAIVELELHHPNQHAVSMNQLANLKWIAKQLDASSETGDLDLLIQHVVTGGQIVIESRDQTLCRQFLLAISNLLPIGCLKLATYKDHYQPEYSTRFNLIGGPINMDIPLEVSDVMVLRISAKDIVMSGEENLSLQDCQIEVRRRPEKDEVTNQPQIVKRYRELLLDPDVNDTVLETTLRTTREYWMSKAKICYQIRNQVKTQNSRVDVFQLIKGIYNEDHQVILFWQAGLSNAYKNHVLSTIESPQSHDVLQH